MYKIDRDGETVAMTEAPTYVRRAENGCFILCREAEAEGIVHNGQVFHLLGRPDMGGAAATVMLEETDAGSEIARTAETGGIMFVTLAEVGSIDAANVVGNIRRYTDGKLYRCLQAHTSQADWTPDTASSLWAITADPAEEWPAWSQPIGAHDAYSAGAKVSHQEQHWISDTDNNVWEPGVYGWTEVVAEV